MPLLPPESPPAWSRRLSPRADKPAQGPRNFTEPGVQDEDDDEKPDVNVKSQTIALRSVTDRELTNQRNNLHA